MGKKDFPPRIPIATYGVGECRHSTLWNEAGKSLSLLNFRSHTNKRNLSNFPCLPIKICDFVYLLLYLQYIVHLVAM